MVQSSWSSRSRVLPGLLAMVLLAALLVGTSTAPARAATKDLAIKHVSVACECGGAGYLWGWGVVAVEFRGARDGYKYKIAVKNGPRARAYSYGSRGYGSVSRWKADFEHGKTYRFRVEEIKKRKVVRTSSWTKYEIPRPVDHPDLARIDTETIGDEEVMVAGRTYHLTFDGEWGEGTQIASGVDRYWGEDRFGWYEEDDYPLPWQLSGTEAISEFTPTEEFVGTYWNILAVGYRPAEKADRKRGIEVGDPVPGSEWGYWFTVRIVSEEEAERARAGAGSVRAPGGPSAS